MIPRVLESTGHRTILAIPASDLGVFGSTSGEVAMLEELRFALRILRKNPGYTLPAIATLALATGLSTVMFSVLNATLFRPLPYRAPNELVMLWMDLPDQNRHEGRPGYWNVEQWRSQSGSF